MHTDLWGRASTALIAGALGALLATGTASAQVTGEIRGRVENAATDENLATVVIIAQSNAALGDQFGLSEADGSFAIPLLPPGTYTLRFEIEGFRPRTVGGVIVELGRTTALRVELAPTAIEGERIVVTAPETSPIDRGSFETGTNINREFYRNVPSGRRYTEILQDTPGSVEDPYGTSVFGSTSVENTYIIEGLNTTDVGFGRAAADLNVDFFEELEIKTGGYMPEYGRSTGGIFNLVLRSGGNEFHGDIFANVAPGFLRATPETIYRVGEAIGREDIPALDMDVGFAIGGPIIPDRLWFFAGFNPSFTFTDVNRIYQAQFDEDGDGTPDLDENGNVAVREVGREGLSRRRLIWQFAGKLSFAVTPDHMIAASYYGNPSSVDGVLRAIDDSQTDNGINGARTYYDGRRLAGSHNMILNYAGELLDQAFRIEAFVGYHTQRDVVENTTDMPIEQYLYPRQLEEFEPGTCPLGPTDLGCFVDTYHDGGTGFYYDETLDRFTGGLRFTNVVQNHQIRYGGEVEYKTYSSTRGYSGGYYGLHYGDDPTADPYTIERDYFAQFDASDNLVFNGVGDTPAFNASVATLTTSAFLQDLWTVNDYLTVGGGLRWDMESIGDTMGASPIVIADEFAPRLGASFDPTGVGKSRIYASYGWFYESVPLDINQRSFSAEGTAIRYVDDGGEFICFDYDGNEAPRNADGTCGEDPVYCMNDSSGQIVERDAAGGCPPGSSPFSATQDPYGVLGGENSPVVNGLQGQFHDEWVVGAEYEVADGWIVGVSAVARRLLRAIEDISVDDGNTYFIANPGENDCNVPNTFRDEDYGLQDFCGGVDADDDGFYEEWDESRTIFPKPTRLYEGLVISTRRRLADHTQFLASYTLSRLVGNYAGLYSPDNDQLDPNISSQYDLVSLVENRYGLLPNNHTHVIKLAGSYEFGGITPTLDGLTVGLRYTSQSGSPINFLGRHEFYGRNEVFILPRGSGGETPWVHRFDLFIGYDVKLGGDYVLNFNATIFNLLNFQEVTAVNQEYTDDVMQPHPDGTPLTDLTNIDGDPVNVSPTYGEPISRQDPINVRLGVRLSF